ncbi:MAG: hypothetical protein AAGI15_15160 [Pseudomonadota bacterium]
MGGAVSPAGLANSDYAVAWAVAAGGGLLAFVFWCLMTRGIRRGSLRWALRLLPGAWMLVPAPVPGYDGQYAPAFVVVLFETLLKDDGTPQTALAILAVASVVVLIAVSIVSFLRWRTGRSGAAEPRSAKATRAG